MAFLDGFDAFWTVSSILVVATNNKILSVFSTLHLKPQTHLVRLQWLRALSYS